MDREPRVYGTVSGNATSHVQRTESGVKIDGRGRLPGYHRLGRRWAMPHQRSSVSEMTTKPIVDMWKPSRSMNIIARFFLELIRESTPSCVSSVQCTNPDSLIAFSATSYVRFRTIVLPFLEALNLRRMTEHGG